jgi:hypothetical protein
MGQAFHKVTLQKFSSRSSVSISRVRRKPVAIDARCHRPGGEAAPARLATNYEKTRKGERRVRQIKHV